MGVRCGIRAIGNPNRLNIKSSAYNERKPGDWRHTRSSARATGVAFDRAETVKYEEKQAGLAISSG
jgi:hypothetical protein